mmetsp:Transcript_17290/g.42004  ORF Transcript_17290/g.42004 Transcript_17290/m.42004 type:complete len:86 (-) Transcript_17290:384-641(-)
MGRIRSPIGINCEGGVSLDRLLLLDLCILNVFRKFEFQVFIHLSCLILDRTIYGLVQSSRVYYETYSKEIERFGFRKSMADPCLF